MSVRALLFTDVVDSMQTTARMGDVRSAQVWAEHDRRARELLVRHRGREIDRSDGFFLLFEDVHDAASYALAYHRALADLAFAARVGVHVGAVTLRENAPEDIARGAKPVEVEGLAKPLAARIMALASGGQTLLSAAAQAALGNTMPEGSELASHGHYRLKGVEAPIEVFELGAESATAFAPPGDNDKAYRVVQVGGSWRPVRDVRHNLPAERDAFVGRTDELRDMAARLDGSARLLTVVGTGGTGKTRFVRRYGWSWLGDWPGGVCFCDLSEARSLDGIYFALASALDVPLGKEDPAMQLGHAIAGRGRCLVILDNFEQVIAHAAATIGRWLDRAVEASFVVTSRERLRLPGEDIFSLSPLSLEKDAVDLFVARACAQRADFALTDASRPLVRAVAGLLDGLPLAIELAASRVRVLSVAQILERLEDRFSLLAGSRGTVARQATLRAAIDWSWDLLSPWEQAALAQCSVFEGGFTLEAAEAVLDVASWRDAPSTLDVVQALVDKSLLHAWVLAAQGRYDIDEPYFGIYVSIREYAAEKLVASGTGNVRAAQERHGGYFARFGAEEALEALDRHGGVKRRRALAIGLDNVVAACRRAVARRDCEQAVATLRAGCEVLELRGPFSLAMALGAQVLALDGMNASLRTAALRTRAGVSQRCGRMEEARAWLMEALFLSRQLLNARQEARVQQHLGHVERDCGRLTEARSHFDAALAIHRVLGDLGGEGTVLASLGVVHWRQGRVEEAQEHLQAALAIHRKVGNRRSEGSVVGNLGSLFHERGRLEDAREHHEAALAIHREVGNRRFEGIVLANIGAMHYERGRIDDARVHAEAALAIHREVGDRPNEGTDLGNLGCLDLEQGRLETARARFEGALSIHREVGNRFFEGSVLGDLGEMHHQQGRIEEARAHLHAALAIQRELGDRRNEGITLGRLGALAAGDAQLREARDAFRIGEALLREVEDRSELAKLLCAKGKLELAAGDAAAARSALGEAATLAAGTSAGPESALGQKIAELRKALGVAGQARDVP